MSTSKTTAAEGATKFAADRMLGRLVKWLRVLGCDVIYGPHLTGYGLIRAARAEERLILTRDRRLKQKQPPPFILIESDHYRDQLRQVIGECRFEFGGKLFTRCLECNSLLQVRSKETVEQLVPAYVFSTQERFSWCAQCRRVYWPATHQQKMVEELKKIGLG
ncbi:MAG: Mut7-C RNAse domain-containing protein [Candidatus Binatia bacterium]